MYHNVHTVCNVLYHNVHYVHVIQLSLQLLRVVHSGAPTLISSTTPHVTHTLTTIAAHQMITAAAGGNLLLLPITSIDTMMWVSCVLTPYACVCVLMVCVLDRILGILLLIVVVKLICHNSWWLQFALAQSMAFLPSIYYWCNVINKSPSLRGLDCFS